MYIFSWRHWYMMSVITISYFLNLYTHDDTFVHVLQYLTLVWNQLQAFVAIMNRDLVHIIFVCSWVCTNGFTVFLQKVGCDGIVGSKRTLDSCGVCGGDGTSCAPSRVPTRRHATRRAGHYVWHTSWTACSKSCGVRHINDIIDLKAYSDKSYQLA